MSFNKTMKSRTDLHVVLSGSVFALFLPVMALSPNRALAGGLDISLNFEVAPPPPTETVVVEQGAPAQEVVVQGEPPPPQTEVIVDRPSPQHVWVAGYWHWMGNHYAWIGGHWMLPPGADVEWIPPHVEHRAVFIPGHWHRLPVPPPVAVVEVAPPQYETVVVENDAPAVEMVATMDPPPPQQEVIIERPSPRHIWIAGYWHWQDNHYGWVRGHWMLPPREGVIWMPPRYENRSGRRVFIAGSWHHNNFPQGAPAGHLAVAVVEVAPPQYETVVVENNAPAVEMAVTMDPPPPQQEVIIERPSPRHVWIAGYWHWQDNRYGWVRGHWMLPPREGVIWVPPRYENRSGRRVFITGSWRHGNAPQGAPAGHLTPPEGQHSAPILRNPPPGPGSHAFVIREAPPALRHEQMGARPSPKHVWIAGYWKHDGHAYVWEPGRWDMPPREGLIWVAPRWESREGSWVLIEGRWDHR